MHFNNFIKCDISKYEAVYFVGDNQAINRVRVGSFKTRNQGAFSGSLAALILRDVSKHVQQSKSLPYRARMKEFYKYYLYVICRYPARLGEHLHANTPSYCDMACMKHNRTNIKNIKCNSTLWQFNNVCPIVAAKIFYGIPR